MKKQITLMEMFEKTYKRSSKATIGGTISINDLREKEEERGGKLNEEERLALHNYEKHRINELNKALNEEEFYKKYKLLQVLANLRPYQDFLKMDNGF